MSKMIILQGVQIDSATRPEQAPSGQIRLTSKGCVQLGVSRDAESFVTLPDIQPNEDLACIEYSNGFKVWTRVDALAVQPVVEASRAEGGADTEVLELNLAQELPVAGVERGVVGLTIKVVEFFGVDITGGLSKDLGKRFETKPLQQGGEGLYQCLDWTGDSLVLNPVPNSLLPQINQPILLFIHGTASSSVGSFGKLWEPSGEKAREALRAYYDNRVYFFEHRSLSVSPIENALALVESLPKQAEIHLVSHSRGGLVGELLCLGQRDQTADILTEAFLDKVFAASEYGTQQQQFTKLLSRLDEQQIQITRFVRVACPARGTTLASGRLDRWLSILNFLSGSNDFIELLLAVAKDRTNPSALPGLQAMMPGSALLQVLNHPSLRVGADLTVISGNAAPDALKGLMVDWFADRIFDSDHDLVVNTGSMYGGLSRHESAARFFLDEGAGVSHFNYFKNPKTIEKLAAGLLRQADEPAGFQDLALAKQAEPARDGSMASASGSLSPLASLPKVVPVKLSIRHGNLAYARYPIAVGHYVGDTIVSAEAHLDHRLGGALSNRLRLGLYPGPLHTHEVFLHKDSNAKPNGAIVIGLGLVGELSSGMLASGICQALLDYALKISDWPDDRFGAKATLRSAKVSFLLIGSGFSGMSVRNSLAAILNGVKSANERLLEAGFEQRVRVDEIELLELYLDVAIKAAREMALILNDKILSESFDWQDRTVQAGVGGLQPVLSDVDLDWWHRLEIVYDKKYQLLRYISLADRARAEITLVAGQMQLADKFIAEMISQTGYVEATSQTLFEMLIPNQLKELAPNQYNVMLIVDEASARYPWELLSDRWGGEQQPVAVAAGMLRQLKTPSFRVKPLHTTKQTALVIGNPSILVPQNARRSFADLPGAALEAEVVAQQLLQQGYQVNIPLRGKTTGLTARDILCGLHGDAYRILHFAGHGVHEFVPETPEHAHQESCQACGQGMPVSQKPVSGMVIGHNIFLTPGDIEQMRSVPELVFINCCHLGKTEDKNPASVERYNELAANLGVQFINMGVKACIAAGWAVNDGAAKVFAETFYETLLAGDTFGRAVTKARKSIYGGDFQGVNTWGAYQCYGDPDFRLLNKNIQRNNKALPYHDIAEWRVDLENLLSRVHSSRSAEEGDNEAQERLNGFEMRIPPDKLSSWRMQADIAALLGALYGEWGEYDKAIAYIDQALAANQANFPLKALEQRANYRVKRAIQQLQTAVKADKASIKKDIEQAIEELEMLKNLSATTERNCLLGSAYKRLAWLQTDKAGRQQALGSMGQYYRAASDQGFKNNQFEAYPLINWVVAEILLDWFSLPQQSHEWRDIAHERIDKAILAAEQRLTENPDYWGSVVKPDSLLIKALMCNKFTAEDCQGIIEQYCLAIERGVSYKNKTAIREQLEFLMLMAKHAKQTNIYKGLQEILGKLP